MNDSFADVFAEAVKRRGLGLGRIVARLETDGVPVSAATLSYWQTGRSVPTRARSLRTLEALERILEVPQGTLTERTSHYLRTMAGPWHEQLPSETAMQIVRELGYTGPSLGLETLFSQDTVHIGKNREEASQTITMVVRATMNGVRGWPVVFIQDAPHDALVTINRTVHCRLGENVTIPDMCLFGGELLFPKPLMLGQLAQCSYTVNWDTTKTPSTRIERGVRPGLQLASLQVEFQPDDLPSSVEAYWLANSRTPEQERQSLGPVTIDNGLAQFVSGPLKPGSVGLSWSWAEPSVD